MRFKESVATALTLAAASACWALSVQVASREIIISGLNPGASVAVLGVVYWGGEFFPTRQPIQEQITDEGSRGEVTLTFAQDLPVMTVVAAVSLETGEVAVAAHPEYPYGLWRAEPDLPGPPGVGRSELPLPRVRRGRVLLVRPGAGAWVGSTLGAAEHLPLDRMRPLKGNALPSRGTAAGDVVLGLDEEHLEFWQGKVGR
ncbi:MAG: hypothetical protein KatS3mg007_1836 [Thermoanaerobaculum sp.]|nr:MAG: hypothetical protein KatS3mg007_1836 [Thermoanaerobaculum sp.]